MAEKGKAGMGKAKLTTHDVKVLRLCNGEEISNMVWGAAMSVSIEFLKGAGYISLVGTSYKITEAGKEALKNERYL